MKRFGIAILCCCLCCSAAAAAVQNVSSQIKAVTLFSSQALIERQATATVDKGLHEILLTIDTLRVDPDSVTARVFGAGEVFSVQYREIPVADTPRENVRRLEEKLRQLILAQKALKDRKQTLKKQEAFLDAFIKFSQSQVPKDIATRMPKPEELGQTLSFLSSNYQKVYREIRKLEPQIEDRNREIKAVQKELDALRGGRRASVKGIEIFFQSAKDQKIKIEAQYLARNAQWQPLYKAAVPPDISSIDLTMFSKITQKTGEDWNGVNLVVSTVIPLRGAGLPTLNSWLLDLPRPAIGAALKRAAPSPAPMEVAAEQEAVDAEADFAQARRTQSPLSFEYALRRPMTIASRDKETLLPLFSKKLTGEFHHYSVPKRSNRTFLVAEVKSDKELLSGMLNVHFGGQYVGKTFLKDTNAGEPFNLNLGADRDVIVERRKVRDKVKETYFGKIQRDTVVRELAYKITAENRKDKAVTLKIIDSVPVSKTDRIQVKDLKLTPAPTEKDIQDRQGVMLWEQPLKAGEAKEITIEFVVTYPKDVSPSF